MCSRVASGRALSPSLLLGGERPREKPLSIDPAHVQLVRDGMNAVVNGGGTAGRARMQIEGLKMAGKSGTAQVRRISMAERRRGVIRNEALPWRMRDPAPFIAHATVDTPPFSPADVVAHCHAGTAV